MKKSRYISKNIVQPWRGEKIWAIFTLSTFLITNFVVGVFPNVASDFYMLIGLWLAYGLTIAAIAGFIYYYFEVYQKQLELKKPRPRHYRPDSNYYYNS